MRLHSSSFGSSVRFKCVVRACERVNVHTRACEHQWSYEIYMATSHMIYSVSVGVYACDVVRRSSFDRKCRQQASKTLVRRAASPMFECLKGYSKRVSLASCCCCCPVRRVCFAECGEVNHQSAPQRPNQSQHQRLWGGRRTCKRINVHD